MKRQSVSCFSERSLQSELIKSYKQWLTAPQEKENAMGQFKDYVNTMATIKQENGEKYFLLKKKFYTEYFTNNYPPPPPRPTVIALCPSRTQLQASELRSPALASSLWYLVNGNTSHSLLDEVTAGWAPVSRSVSSASRQLPSIPAQPQPASGHNSLGWGCPLWPRLLLRLQQTGFCGQSEVRSDE